MIIKNVVNGGDLIQEKMAREHEPYEDSDAQTQFVTFYMELDKFCTELELPLHHIHIITNEYFPEFIRDKWQELFLYDNIDFGHTPFGHLIDWRTGIEEAKEEYYEFKHKGEVYWIGV